MIKAFPAAHIRLYRTGGAVCAEESQHKGGVEPGEDPVDAGYRQKTCRYLGGHGPVPSIDAGEEDGVCFPLKLTGKNSRCKISQDYGRQHDQCGEIFHGAPPSLYIVIVEGRIQLFILPDQPGFFRFCELVPGIGFQPVPEQPDPVLVKIRGIYGGQTVRQIIIVGPESLRAGKIDQISDLIDALNPAERNLKVLRIFRLSFRRMPDPEVFPKGCLEPFLVQNSGPFLLRRP